MSYGIRCWSEDGAINLDTSVFTYEILHSSRIDFSSVSAPSSVTVSIPKFNPGNCVAVVLPENVPFPAQWESADNVMAGLSVRLGAVTVHRSNPTKGGNQTRTIFRLIAMRYKV